MSTGTTWQTISKNSDTTEQIGEIVGRVLRGGETIQLRSDVGGGKTTFTRGLARGAGSDNIVQSPSFTLSREYVAPKFTIHHYDFYRLDDPGIMSYEIAEDLAASDMVVVVEWADTVEGVLPEDRLLVTIERLAEDQRAVRITGGSTYAYVYEALRSLS